MTNDNGRRNKKIISTKAKLILNFSCLVVVFLVLWLVLGVVICLFNNKFTFSSEGFTKALLSSGSALGSLGITAFIFIFTLWKWWVKKDKGVDAKRFDEVDLYDKSRYLTPEEIDKFYGASKERKIKKKGKVLTISEPLMEGKIFDGVQKTYTKKVNERIRKLDEFNKPLKDENGLQVYEIKEVEKTYKYPIEDEVEGLIIKSEFRKGKYYYWSAKGVHNLVVGTTGTGKTKALVMPTMFLMAKSKNKPSIVCIDIKGEIQESTNKTFEENGYNVLVLDFGNPRASMRYNPLEIIINYYKRYLMEGKFLKQPDKTYLNKCETEINKLSVMIFPITDPKNSFFDTAARTIFLCIMWGLIEDFQRNKFSELRFNFATVANINKKSPKELRDWILSKKDEALKEGFNSKCYEYGNKNFLGNLDKDGVPNNMLGSVISTYQTDFDQFVGEALLDLTLKSDFNIRNLRDEPTVLFLNVPDEDKSRYPIAALVVNQVYNFLVSMVREKGYTADRSVHFFLDEFGNLPKFDTIDTWLSVGRERKLFMSLFIQSFSQLNKIYGQDGANIIVENCNMKICLGIQEQNSIQKFQDLFGTYTVITQSASTSERNDQQSSTRSFQKDYLLHASDLKNMDMNKDNKNNLTYRDIFFLELHKYPAHTKIEGIWRNNKLDFETPLYKILKFTRYKNEEREEDFVALNEQDWTYDGYTSIPADKLTPEERKILENLKAETEQVQKELQARIDDQSSDEKQRKFAENEMKIFKTNDSLNIYKTLLLNQASNFLETDSSLTERNNLLHEIESQLIRTDFKALPLDESALEDLLTEQEKAELREEAKRELNIKPEESSNSGSFSNVLQEEDPRKKIHVVKSINFEHYEDKQHNAEIETLFKP